MWIGKLLTLLFELTVFIGIEKRYAPLCVIEGRAELEGRGHPILYTHQRTRMRSLTPLTRMGGII